MGRIHVLDKTVSNMIAAGEVVERPASVVKELLENAMDAGAKHITVEIKSGGISYIRVADDGCGMSEEDAKTCLLRHATSKISSAEDLSAISTLGFRGEALASIAAVSKLDIYTKAQEDEAGTHISCDCGEITEISEAGCPNGTTMIVRDLFCSTPARMKFLKKDFTEAGYIADMLNRLALSHPEVSFKLINNGKEALFTSGDGELSGCIYAVYGKEVGAAMQQVNFSEGPVKVSGLTGRGSVSRPNRNMQNFFINGRYIKSPLLARAVEDAYKNEIMVGKFPVFAIHIDLDPQMVDINVHPTKLEAKFADEKQIYHCVYWAVKNALHRNTYIPKVEKTAPSVSFELKEQIKQEKAEPVRIETVLPRQDEVKRAAEIKVRGEHNTITSGTPGITKSVPAKTASSKFTMRETSVFEEMPKEETVAKEIVEKIVEKEENLPIKEKIIIPESKAEVAEPEIKPQDKPETEYKICGQVFGTYVIVEKDGEMLMVDQHAAHERLRYEELLKQYKSKALAAQSMLIPCVVNLSAQEMAIYRENIDEISDLGFDSEEFGENAVALRATPEELSDRDLSDLFIEILTMLSENRKNVSEDLASRMLYSIACKGAIKANHNLHQEEIKALLDAVFALDGINTCPHGRPITIAFTKAYIEKQFKRIV
ncbi:MAG: DNA mismatch repair endonuclease MutL [Clostridia bacterium]|nr:DNA mismatch repair endonuclease MutL [Clostridia bacterium]